MNNNIIDLVIEPQSVDYNNLIQLGIDKNTFFINGKKEKKYQIKEDNLKNSDVIRKIDEIAPLLKDDEMFGYSNNAVFTYIIGSQCPIINNQINRVTYERNNVNINDMHIWLKPALSIQELNTKHAKILNDSKKNYDIITNSDPNTDISVYISTGVIDNIFYAGEIRYSVLNGNKKIELNFLSGTFMLGLIKCDNVPNIIKENMVRFFRERLEFDGEIIISENCETFITKIMDKETMDNYVLSSKLRINDATSAIEFDIIRLEGQIDQKERLLSIFKNDPATIIEVTNEINELKRKLKEKKVELEDREKNIYEPEVFKGTYGGTKKRKKLKKQKTKKQKTKKQKTKKKKYYK